MRFYEYESKQILQTVGIPLPKSHFCSTAQEAKAAAESIAGPVVIKSQVLSGGRMKAGGVKFADTPQEAEGLAQEILDLRIKDLLPVGVLVEEKQAIAQEYFAAVTWDGRAKKPVIIFSDMGGIDIEEVAESHPENLSRAHFPPSRSEERREGKECYSQVTYEW